MKIGFTRNHVEIVTIVKETVIITKVQIDVIGVIVDNIIIIVIITKVEVLIEMFILENVIIIMDLTTVTRITDSHIASQIDLGIITLITRTTIITQIEQLILLDKITIIINHNVSSVDRLDIFTTEAGMPVYGFDHTYAQICPFFDQKH